SSRFASWFAPDVRPGAHRRIGLCGPGLAAKRFGVNREASGLDGKEQTYRDLLRLLPMESLSEHGAGLQAPARPRLYKCEGNLFREQLWRRLGCEGLSS